MNERISVILPAYKEAENLKRILPRLKVVLTQVTDEFEILVIDSQSPLDNSKQACTEAGEKICCISRDGGNAYGDAIRTGIAYAKYEYIVIMDADGSHAPNDIKKMLECMRLENADVVIGSRYIKNGKTENPWILILMSYIVNVVYRIVFKLNVKDVSDSFRMYDSQKLKGVSLECNNFDIVEEILIKMNKAYTGLKIREIPIIFSKRLYGESKRDLVEFVFSYVKTIIRLLKYAR